MGLSFFQIVPKKEPVLGQLVLTAGGRSWETPAAQIFGVTKTSAFSINAQVCVSCFWRCPGISSFSVAHLAVVPEAMHEASQGSETDPGELLVGIE